MPDSLRVARDTTEPKPHRNHLGSPGDASGGERLIANLHSVRELLKGLADDADHHPPELKRRVDTADEAASGGLSIAETLARKLKDGPLDAADSQRLASELPHKILKIHTQCTLLLEDDDRRFSSLSTPLGTILELHGDCCEMIKRLSRTGSTGRGPEQSGDAVPPPSLAVETPWRQPHLAATLTLKSREERRARVLVVDDDSDSREALHRSLEQLGHKVETASDGADALAVLEGQPPNENFDLVLLDLCMQEVDGFAVLRELRLDYTLRSVPVIVVSASSDVGAMIHSIELGADDFLTKPIDQPLLRARVASCLDKGAVRGQDRRLNAELRQAKAKLDDLLYEVFPYTVAQELRTSGRVQPRGCEHVAVGFCDLVGFTSFCSTAEPDQVVEQLQWLFERFDEIAGEHRVEKIKTIGDCYMMTAGVLGRFESPVKSMLEAAIEMQQWAAEVGDGWRVRVGIHVGPLVAGMVGLRQFAFDVWGDTVNIASRVQNAAEPGAIVLSEPAWAEVHHDCRGKSLGMKPLKGTQAMEVFQFNQLRETDAAASPPPAPNRVE